MCVFVRGEQTFLTQRRGGGTNISYTQGGDKQFLHIKGGLADLEVAMLIRSG